MDSLATADPELKQILRDIRNNTGDPRVIRYALYTLIITAAGVGYAVAHDHWSQIQGTWHNVFTLHAGSHHVDVKKGITGTHPR